MNCEWDFTQYSINHSICPYVLTLTSRPKIYISVGLNFTPVISVCFNLFTITVIRHQDKGNLEKTAFTWRLQF